MNISKKIEDVLYDVPYWWNTNYNEESTIANCLPNCTCYVLGECAKQKLPKPISKITDARNWHKYLINGWYAMPYEEYKRNIKVGDIIEWANGNHVAVVSSVDNGLWISGSFYTGINGKSVIDGEYDKRKGLNSLKEVSDFMYKNYPYRYFHNVPIETENNWCNSLPTHVLVAPSTITPTDKNTALNQIYVGVSGLRVRTEPNTSATISGVAPTGYYNVEEVVTGGDFEDGNTWYKVDKYYLAGVKGVVYYPAKQLEPVEEMMQLIIKMQDEYKMLVAENKDLKDRLERIKELC